MPKDDAIELQRQKLDLELDRELEATFPASDALKITRTAFRIRERGNNSAKRRALAQ